jgi:CheY-like chemotaxis protein
VACILVTDDDPDVREVLQDALRNAGHQVETAADGKVAIEAYQRGHHDLVVMDMFMPEMDGLGAIIQLFGIRPSLPIIALADPWKSLEQNFLDMARTLGAARTFRKPVEPSVLIAAVADLVRNNPKTGKEGA